MIPKTQTMELFIWLNSLSSIEKKPPSFCSPKDSVEYIIKRYLYITLVISLYILYVACFEIEQVYFSFKIAWAF